MKKGSKKIMIDGQKGAKEGGKEVEEKGGKNTREKTGKKTMERRYENKGRAKLSSEPGGGMGAPRPKGMGGAICGIIDCEGGAPMPRATPGSPGCPPIAPIAIAPIGGGKAPPAMGSGTVPRPAALPTPGPPFSAACSERGFGGGGASADMETTLSPRSRTNPSMRFSSRSSDAFFPRTFRCSSQSPSTRFMCLSNAMNVPTNTRVSEMVTRIRQLTYCSILLLLPPDCTSTTTRMREEHTHTHKRDTPTLSTSAQQTHQLRVPF